MNHNNLVFRGCSLRCMQHDLERLAIEVLNKANFEYKTWGSEEPCCGLPLSTWGFETDFQRNSTAFVEKLDRMKIDQIVALCPGCYSTIKSKMPQILEKDIKVLHITELLASMIDENRLKFQENLGMTVTYHDPCHLGRFMGVYEAPRKILANMPGIILNEMPFNREDVWCCGGMIRAPFTELSRSVTHNLLADAKSTKADAVVTSCPTCYMSLSIVASKKGLPIFDMIELVAAAQGIIRIKKGN